MARVDIRCALLGMFFLTMGLLMYLMSRPVGSVLFLAGHTELHSVFHLLPDIFCKVNAYAPDYFHPLAFSLIAGSIATTRTSRRFLCALWFITDALFELGQNNSCHFEHYLTYFPEESSMIRGILEYFIRGTYDMRDLIAIALGSLTALLLLELSSFERRNTVHG